MSCQNANTLALERIPDVARPIIVTTEEDTTRDGECDGCDTAKDVVVREGVELTVGANVEETARRVIGTRREGIPVREEAFSMSAANTSTTAVHC